MESLKKIKAALAMATYWSGDARFSVEQGCGVVEFELSGTGRIAITFDEALELAAEGELAFMCGERFCTAQEAEIGYFPEGSRLHQAYRTMLSRLGKQQAGT